MKSDVWHEMTKDDVCITVWTKPLQEDTIHFRLWSDKTNLTKGGTYCWAKRVKAYNVVESFARIVQAYIDIYIEDVRKDKYFRSIETKKG